MAQAAKKFKTNARSKHKAQVIELKLMTDEELYGLILQYGKHFYKVLKYKDGYDVEKDEIIGELAVKACEAKLKYESNKCNTATLRTFLITAFGNRMADYRKYLYIRQRKFPIKRMLEGRLTTEFL